MSLRRRTRSALPAIGLWLGAWNVAPASPASVAARGTVDARDTVMVSSAWVAGRLNDPHLVLIHVGTKPGYDSAHIAGARFLPFSAVAARSEAGLALELPPVERLDSVFESLGVSDDSRVVLYWGADWVTPTARVYLTLDYLGLGARTSILDGGLGRWQAEGRAVAAQAPQVKPGSLTPRPRPEIVVAADRVRDDLQAPGVRVLDARTSNFYSGVDAGSMPRAGRLPGAGNVPFTSLVDDSLRFVDDAALRDLFASAGARPGDRIIAYCHIGQQASLLYAVGRHLGFEVQLYDGSFQEWSRRDDLPVEAPPQAGLPKLLSTEDIGRWIEQGRDMTVIDARSDLGAYLANHLPGAVFLHNETLRATARGIPADLLSAEEYAAVFGRLGIRRDRPAVIYSAGESQSFLATFIAWLLRGFGHPNVYVLDGGYERWVGQERPVSRKYPAVAAAAFSSRGFAPDVATLEDVRRGMNDPNTMLVDARPMDQFSGAAGAQLRRGHIPGAVDHFWATDLEATAGGKVFKSLDALRASYAAQGITPDKSIITYCNTGTEASHLYFVLRALLGYPNVRIYVPSWTEWSEREDLPVAVGER